MQHVVLESASEVEELHQAGRRRLTSTVDDSNSSNDNPSATTLMMGGHMRFSASPLLFKFSAAHKEGVKLQMSALAEYLRVQLPEIPDGNKTLLADLAFTLSERRTLLEWRATISALTVEELIESIGSFQTEPIAALKQPRIAFVFTGQGSQWPGMSRDLMRYPAFATIIETCENYLQDLGAAWSLSGMNARINDSIG